MPAAGRWLRCRRRTPRHAPATLTDPRGACGGVANTAADIGALGWAPCARCGGRRARSARAEKAWP
jgi:hypothetical protein